VQDEVNRGKGLREFKARRFVDYGVRGWWGSSALYGFTSRWCVQSSPNRIAGFASTRHTLMKRRIRGESWSRATGKTHPLWYMGVPALSLIDAKPFMRSIDTTRKLGRKIIQYNPMSLWSNGNSPHKRWTVLGVFRG
jgi:hypothetical protein